MSGDTFMEPKQGRSTGSKIFLVLLILGGGMLILCCGGGFLLNRDSGLEETKEAAEARTSEMVDIEIPDYYKGKAGMKLNLIFMEMSMAIYEMKEGLEVDVTVLDEDPIGQNDIKKKNDKQKNNEATKENKKENKKPDLTKKQNPKKEKKKTDPKKKKDVDQKKKIKTKTEKTKTKKSDGALVLMWISVIGMDPEDREEMRKEMGKNSNTDFEMDIESSSSEEITIRGMTVDAIFRKGTKRRSIRQVRSVEVVFPGKNGGFVMLSMQVPESLYKHDEVIKMLKNIK